MDRSPYLVAALQQMQQGPAPAPAAPDYGAIMQGAKKTYGAMQARRASAAISNKPKGPATGLFGLGGL